MPQVPTAPQPLTLANMPPVGRRWRDVPDAVQGSAAAAPSSVPSDAAIAAAQQRLAADLDARKTRLGW